MIPVKKGFIYLFIRKEKNKRQLFDLYIRNWNCVFFFFLFYNYASDARSNDVDSSDEGAADLTILKPSFSL